MKKTTILCPATLTLGLISSKWKAHILNHIGSSENGCRFGELSRLVPDVSRKVLTDSLTEMVEDGFLNREEYPQIPPKVVYTLTSLGEDVQPVITVLADFGFKYIQKNKPKVSEFYGEDKVESLLKLVSK